MDRNTRQIVLINVCKKRQFQGTTTRPRGCWLGNDTFIIATVHESFYCWCIIYHIHDTRYYRNPYLIPGLSGNNHPLECFTYLEWQYILIILKNDFSRNWIPAAICKQNALIYTHHPGTWCVSPLNSFLLWPSVMPLAKAIYRDLHFHYNTVQIISHAK